MLIGLAQLPINCNLTFREAAHQITIYHFADAHYSRNITAKSGNHIICNFLR